MAERPTAPPHPGAQQAGVALITAVFVVAMVAALAASLMFSHQLWLRQIQNTMDAAQSDAIRRGGENSVMELLMTDARQNATDDRTEDWAQASKDSPIMFDVAGREDAALGGYIDDAQGKFNINNLVQNNQPSENNIKLLAFILAGLGFDQPQVLVDVVVDWIDPDGERRPYGAEDNEYLSMDPPYRAANRPLQSVYELRLLRGFTDVMVDALAAHVTALPAPTPVNVNTTTSVVLNAIFSNNLSETQAQDIIDNLKTNPLSDKGQLTGRVPDFKPLDPSLYDIKTSYFDATIITAVGRLQRFTEVMIHRPPQGSPTVLWQSDKIHIRVASDESD